MEKNYKCICFQDALYSDYLAGKYPYGEPVLKEGEELPLRELLVGEELDFGPNGLHGIAALQTRRGNFIWLEENEVTPGKHVIKGFISEKEFGIYRGQTGPELSEPVLMDRDVENV